MYWPMNNLGTYLLLYVWPLEGKSTKCVLNLKKPNSELFSELFPTAQILFPAESRLEGFLDFSSLPT